MIVLDKNLTFDPVAQCYYYDSKIFPCNNITKRINRNIITTKDIKSVVLFITNACNLSCPYCYEWKKKKAVMNTEYVDKIIDIYGSDLSGFAFFGGEPFVEYNYIKHLHEHIKKRLPKATISINTNGTLITEEILSWVKDNNISLVFSWDGYDDNKRYNGNQDIADRVLNTIISAKKMGITCSSRFTVTDITFEKLKESVDKLLEHDIKFVIEPAVDVSNNYIMDSSTETIIKYYELEDEYIRNLPDYKNIKNQLEIGAYKYYGCGAGRRVIRMDTNGNIYDCHRQMPNEQNFINNITTINDKQDLNNTRFFDCKVTNRSECAVCSYKYICGGGCAYSYSDNYCKIYKSKINAILKQLFYDYFSKN